MKAKETYFDILRKQKPQKFRKNLTLRITVPQNRVG